MRPESQWLAGGRPIIRVCREWDARGDLCAGCACMREGDAFLYGFADFANTCIAEMCHRCDPSFHG
jgi:hypothetical protein